MNDDEKREKIVEIVCAIDTSLWVYNDYGNSRSFCETEFNGTKIKLVKTEKPDGTILNVEINIDGIDFHGYVKGAIKFNEIANNAHAQRERQKANAVTNIYNKLITV